MTVRQRAVVPDGHHLRMLDLATGASTDMGILGHHPSWSPTGDLVAFVAPGGILTVMSPSGANQRPVGRGGGYQLAASWSPDGAWLVAQSAATGRLDVIEVATGRALALGAATSGMVGPSWRP